MLYLIDGHNLIPHIPGLSLRQIDDEAKLLEVLLSYKKGKRLKLEVFFDGALPGFSGRKNVGGIIVHYVARSMTADEAIKRRLGQIPAGSGVTVVSSDRQVKTEARSHRAEVISSKEFSQKIADRSPNRENPKPIDDHLLDSTEVDQWLKEFGEKP